MHNAGTWSEVVVAGHVCDVFEPTTRNPNGYVIIYLHGVHQGRLADHQPFVELFEQSGFVVIGPRTARSWWTDKICREFDENLTAQQYVIEHVMPFVREAYGTRPPQIALLGTSMGGQGALRFAYKFPDLFPVVAAISPAIDYQKRLETPEEDDDPLFEMYLDPEAARQDTALLHIHPLNWPRNQFFCCDPTDYRWFDSSDRLRMKLGSLGVPFECDLETSAGGHGFQYYNAMAERAMSYILNSLNSERLRVV
ncbi:MAG: hypothetical protein KDB27_23230 [Planctomycetales bacterium]|nr:hypothetical protein [Planctomycetales bacterium]